ncbi:Coiled-coil domain-containing protein [Schistosoma japonicum]|nr:Coiled-coil domain-containing protein [Schistosoma japonicum]KAH8868729.1 Coiled-coil domain-containing protein [Schistosoma japonicum]
MADSASELELESDASSVDGTKDSLVTNEQILRRIDSLQQENRVLKTEVETLKLKIKGLNDLNQQLRRNSVSIQAKAEQEEEYISNTLLKKITELKKEKESLALNYEQEEECLTNELNRKFTQLRQEKVALERTLAREQENQVSKLMRRIEKLEADMNHKQDCLDRLRREKIELENALEQEQEALVNRLWKKMEKLESEKKILREKLESVGAPLPSLSSNQNLSSISDGIPNNNSTVPRPISSGPGSLRSSFRQHIHPPHTSSSSIGASFSATAPVSPGRIPVSSTSEEKALPSGQYSISNDTNSKTNVTECNGAPFPLPPQSPMDIDASDPNASGAASPCGSVGLQSLPTTPSHSYSLRSPSTPCAVHKVLVSQELSAANQSSDTSNNSAHVISTSYVNRLRDEVYRLRQLLQRYEAESAYKMPQYESEEKSVAEENRRLRKLLQVEKERREALSRQLSESESSLEMEDERQFNEASRSTRLRTISDCTSPFQPPVPAPWTPGGNNSSSLYGPGHAFAVAVAAGVSGHSSARLCRECGQPVINLCSADSTSVSGGRLVSTSLHNSSYVNNLRNCSGRCCSPVTNANTSDIHSVHASNSPSTPTTSSSLNSDHFVKPIYPAATSPQQNPYYYNTIPSLSTDSNRISSSSSSSEKRFSTYSINEKDLQKPLDLEDGDEEDDSRCITPPSCHS